jgi:LacI family transcriptional regulator
MTTQADIAKRLGISQGAVASVVGSYSGRRLLRREMEEKVRHVADELGYRPHRQAQLLRGGRSGVLGILHMGHRGLAFSAERMTAVETAVRAAGFEPLSRDMSRQENPRAVCDRFLGERVEGLLLALPVEWFPVAEIRRLRQFKVPLAALSGMVLPGVPQVHADGGGGMRALTRHLIGLGRRRLAFLTVETFSRFHPRRDRFWRDRIRGFEAAVIEAGGRVVGSTADPGAGWDDVRGDAPEIIGRVLCYPCVADGASPYAQGEEALRTVLAWPRRPDAVLCSNDDWALGALAVCGERGVRVPDDLAVTGFDGTMQGAYYNPRLTTVAQPIHEMAGKAVDLLLRQIRGERLPKKELKLVLPCNLVVRASCGARRDTG